MYYIYTHTDLEGNIFYIGKGTKDNFHPKGHNRAYTKTGRTPAWREAAKNGYTVNIINEYSSEEECLNDELLKIQECEKCINKYTRRSTLEYKLIPIRENCALLRIGVFKENVYILFDNGDIFNNTGLKLTPSNNGKGYLVVKFPIKIKELKYKEKVFYVHRLIAEAFIPNPNNKKVVNHIDRNKSNNFKNNLEWCTQKENVHHSLKLGSYDKLRKKVIQINYDGNIINIFENVSKVCEFFNCTEELIQQAANKKNKCLSAKGYIWVYEEDFNTENKKLKLCLQTYSEGVNQKIKNSIKLNIIDEYNLQLKNFKTKNKCVMSLSKQFSLSKKSIYNILNKHLNNELLGKYDEHFNIKT